jgi:NAD(P)-dependent dehydrogenase (short-subunit alcohol dehydrogenase family)
MNRERVVVITGASSGIGRATAQAFGRQGAKVGLLARGREGLDGAAKEVEAAGGQALTLPTDVADVDQVEAAATAVEQQLGPIDIWVNGAMTSVFAPFKEIEPAEFRRVTEVTYLGFVHGTHAALRRMLPRDHGTIVQIGSALAYRGIPLQSAYCGAKHAIQGFTESVRTELLHDRSNVAITMVQLPGVNTPQFDLVLNRLPNTPKPVAPFFQPEVAANAIVWAADHPRHELLVTGAAAGTVLLNRIAPGLLDRFLGRTGYKAQQSKQPDDPNRPDYLWEPVPGDHGIHGRFDDKAKTRSIHMQLAMRRRRVAVAGVAAAALAGLTRRG